MFQIKRLGKPSNASCRHRVLRGAVAVAGEAIHFLVASAGVPAKSHSSASVLAAMSQLSHRLYKFQCATDRTPDESEARNIAATVLRATEGSRKGADCLTALATNGWLVVGATNSLSAFRRMEQELVPLENRLLDTGAGQPALMEVWSGPWDEYTNYAFCTPALSQEAFQCADLESVPGDSPRLLLLCQPRRTLAGIVDRLPTRLEQLEAHVQQLAAEVGDLPKEPVPDPRPWDRVLRQLREREEQDIDRHLLQPILKQLMLLDDHLGELSGSPDPNAAQMLRDEVRQMLALHGVEPFEANGHQFDRAQQKCVGYQAAANPGGEGAVAQRVRCGFRRGEQILRYEEVTVWRYEPAVHKSALTNEGAP